MSQTWAGTIYDSGTLVATGNSGWMNMEGILGLGGSACQPAFTRAFLRLVPVGLATDETMDLVLAVAWDAAGDSTVDFHAFTQVTATNAVENVILPGDESSAILGTTGIFPSYWKLTWTLAGTTKSMSFKLHGCLEW